MQALSVWDTHMGRPEGTAAALLLYVMLCYVTTIGHDPKTLLGDCLMAKITRISRFTRYTRFTRITRITRSVKMLMSHVKLTFVRRAPLFFKSPDAGIPEFP